MTTVRYGVTGEHSAPKDFKNYTFRTFLAQQKLHITANQTEVDDLAARRGNKNTSIEFDLQVTETHTDNDTFVVGGTAEIGRKKYFVLIEVTDRVQVVITY